MHPEMKLLMLWRALAPLKMCSVFRYSVARDLASWRKYKIKSACFDYWCREWQNNIWDCPALRSLLPDLRCHPGFLLNNNRLDKQLARIRLDYVSLNGFLFRHGLSHHNYCDSCYFSSDSTIIQSAAHHLFHCPLFVQERGVLFSAVNSALNRPDNFPVTSEDLLSPSGISRTDFRIAEAICAFTMSTMNGFM